MQNNIWVYCDVTLWGSDITMRVVARDVHRWVADHQRAVLVHFVPDMDIHITIVYVWYFRISEGDHGISGVEGGGITDMVWKLYN